MQISAPRSTTTITTRLRRPRRQPGEPCPPAVQGALQRGLCGWGQRCPSGLSGATPQLRSATATTRSNEVRTATRHLSGKGNSRTFASRLPGETGRRRRTEERHVLRLAWRYMTDVFGSTHLSADFNLGKGSESIATNQNEDV